MDIDRGSMSDQFLIGRVIDEKYRVEERIAHGGMGVVYLAHDINLDRDVALKVLNPRFSGDSRFVDRFMREARTVGKLTHPGIVAVHDRGIDGDVMYIVMSYVDGPSLETLIAKHGDFFDGKIVARLGLKVLDPLVHIHNLGIVHRDIKPANIVIAGVGLEGEYDIRLVDFGIVKLLEEEQGGLTSGLETLGTAEYMSPEQIKTGKVDGRSDVFSLGSILYRMITGQLPFGNLPETPPNQKTFSILSNDLVNPRNINSRVPRALERIVLKSLDREPDERYTSIEMQKDLESFLADEKIRVSGSLRRRLGYSPAGYRKLRIGTSLVSGLLATATAFGAVTNVLNYRSSVYPVLDCIQEHQGLNFASVNELCPGLSDGLFDRFYWLYESELEPLRLGHESGAVEAIYPFGTYHTTGNPGHYFYFKGNGTTSGFHIPLFYLAFDHFSQQQTEADAEEKSQKMLDAFFYFSSQLFFAGEQQSARNEHLNLIVDRFYLPARVILTDMTASYPEVLAEHESEARLIVENYAKALKFLAEKKYNPTTGTIAGSAGNDQDIGVDGRSDHRGAGMLADGFRLLDLESEVLAVNDEFIEGLYEGHESRYRSVVDYLEIMITDTDSKVRDLVDPETGASYPISRNHTSLLLGLVYRVNLLDEIAEAFEVEAFSGDDAFSVNMSKLPLEYAGYVDEKRSVYHGVIQSMISYYLSQMDEGMIPSYYFEDVELEGGEVVNNPVSNLANMRFLEAIRLYGVRSFDGLDLDEVGSRILRSVMSEQFISGRIGGRTSLRYPHGILKMAGFDNGAYAEVTYSESDLHLLINVNAAEWLGTER